MFSALISVNCVQLFFSDQGRLPVAGDTNHPRPGDTQSEPTRSMIFDEDSINVLY
jgi:hypothetical protein